MSTRTEARAAVQSRAEVATVVGTLIPGCWAVDVDPVDTGSESEAGEAVGEELVAWCEGHGVPWLLRASGRTGGRHLLARVPDELVTELRRLCRQLAGHHGPSATVRRTVRLLTAPHRAGFKAPILGGTLVARDLPQRADPTRDQGVPAGRAARRRNKKDEAGGGQDRSAREFGDALVRARADWSAPRAWAAANVAGSKAAERGKLWWRRYVWAVAVTVAAAEDGVSEPEAWARFQTAAPTRARQLGLLEWRQTYWRAAVAEAERERPRRHHLQRHSTGTPAESGNPAEDHTAEQAEVSLISETLQTAAAQASEHAGLRPQCARSLAAAVHALADVIVRREGSISTRDWAVRARLDPKTLRTARDLLAEHGVLVRARSYESGPNDTDAWLPGPVTTALMESRRQTSPTRWDTPLAAAPSGAANPTRLRRQARCDRQIWRLRHVLSLVTEVSGQTYVKSQHPAAKALRSLWHQRRWWQSLTPVQQECRRKQRRAILGAMHRSERTAWFDWLNRRATIAAAAQRYLQGDSVDWPVLASAPQTIHLGLRDPGWRGGGTPRQTPPGGEQLALVA